MVSGFHVVVAETPMGRPLPGHGADAVTLVIHSRAVTPYSLSDNLEVLACQLRRVRTKLVMVSSDDVTEKQMAEADYLVLFCPQPNPRLPEAVVAAVSRRDKPSLWVGFGADRILRYEPYKNQFRFSSFPRSPPSLRVLYRGREWKATVEPWIPAVFQPGKQCEMVMSLRPEREGAPDLPLCWRVGPVTFYASIPSYGTWNHLFSDLLLDFYQVRDVPESRVFIRLEDYHCRRNHRDFRRIVDYLHARKHPFMVAVIPAYRDPGTGEWLEMDAQPDFVEALRYAQEHGGRLVVHGYTHAYKDETGEGHEFWDVAKDRPIPEDGPEYAQQRVRRGIRQMLAHGLLPLAWETPHYAGSRSAYSEVAGHFSTAVERVQLSDATYLESFEASALTEDRFGRLVVPENLGFVLAIGSASTHRIRAVGDVITRLRGTIAGCFFHPYLSFDRFEQLIGVIEDFRRPFLDLADLGHWVQLPEMVLLTGDAARTVTLRGATVKWRAFDRSGKLLAEETEPAPVTGERIFKRRGRGDVEIFEFHEP